MHLLCHFYYWASDRCPDAIPAGVIAVNLGLNVGCPEDTAFTDEVEHLCNDLAIFDDALSQLGYGADDADLLMKIDGQGHGVYLCNRQVVPDWQWELMKARSELRYAEHDLDETMRETCGLGLSTFLEPEGPEGAGA